MTFYEVQARSIINKVPESSYVPFRWTINPYRGCSHACAYCLRGDTSILMANGRTKPIADVKPADKVYGTVWDGKYRRYVTTHVRAHWSTVKPAYRITLEDGTGVVSSGDHRFLTNRGWKYVTGAEQGRERRPHLTPNNKLMGTGRFASPPDYGADFRRGYLCGMIRGDGHVGSYVYERAGRSHGDVHRFRLALIDLEGIQRTRHYLTDMHISTQEFVFQEAIGGRRAIHAIRASARAQVQAVRDVIDWPSRPSLEWSKGFLSGIFDAEGHYSRGVLRFSNTDFEILANIASALDRLGFQSRFEVTAKSNGLCTIRLLGGVREALRFFHTTDPAITRKRSIEGQTIKNKSPLRVTSIEPLGLRIPMYDITTGTGDFIANGVVSHNCFARKTHTYLDLDYGEDFDRRIVVKVNAPELLRRELSDPKWKGEHIAMGTNVDTYQRAEGRYRLMRGILEALRDFANPFSILTKGTLILRDLDLLVECAEVSEVAANVSVGSVDQDLWKAIESGTPNPLRRLEACHALNQAGVPCGVLMAPVLPFISDSDEALEETVRAIAAAGATHIAPITLHLRKGGSREWFLRWLNERYPELVPRYRELFGERAYAPKAYQREIAEKVARLARKHRIGPTTGRRARAIEEEPPHPEQLTLA
jgi:DNA repair photolyase